MHQSKPYRKCVGLVIINKDNKIFVGKRIDSNLNAWQMPQGGIEPGENPLVAGLREMEEEIGTKNVEYLDEINSWLNYDIPSNLSEKLWNGQYRGQTQKWLAYRFLGKNDEINIKTKNPEFIEWKWILPDKLPEVIVNFKKEMYIKLLKIIKEFIG